MKKWAKNIIALCFGLFLSLLLIEIILHIYNPFKSRVHGGRITLPINVNYEFDNSTIPGLDKHIVHRKNKLGLRGPDLPEKNAYKIFCVGGSTAECFYLSDGQDWPALLMKKLQAKNPDVWINNAGLDGHSTFGHIVLLRDHLLKLDPQMIIFLVGCNDVAAGNSMNLYEKYYIDRKSRILEYSEIFNIIQNYRMVKIARERGLGHHPVNFAKHEKRDTANWSTCNSKWCKNLDSGLNGYKQRILTLGKSCSAKGVIPVFVTQPTILGNYIDPVTGSYLGAMDFEGESGMHYWFVLNQYNELLKQLCDENRWVCIDAANKLEASSDNYYDFFHYTKNGSTKMADIIYEELVHSDKVK